MFTQEVETSDNKKLLLIFNNEEILADSGGIAIYEIESRERIFLTRVSSVEEADKFISNRLNLS